MSLISIQQRPAPASGPVGLVSDGTHLWNTDFSTATLYRLDPASGKIVGSYRCPGRLSGIAWDGELLWQAILDEGWLRAIDPATGDFVRTVVVADAGWIAGTAWDGNQLWCVAQQKGQLLAVDPDSGKITQRLSIPAAGGGLAWHDGALWLGVPLEMRFDPPSGLFEWTTAAPTFALRRINPATGAVEAEYNTDFLPMGIAWQADTVWLSHTGGATLHQFRLP